MNRIPVQLNYKARRQFEAFHEAAVANAVARCRSLPASWLGVPDQRPGHATVARPTVAD
jgi:hypothetical protein